MVSIGAYNVGFVGLNLQKLYYNSIHFDSPPNRGWAYQSVGRLRYIGQKLTVERLDLSVENGFQDRELNNTLSKALPRALAEIPNSRARSTDEGEVGFSVGDFYMYNGDPIQVLYRRIANLPAEPRLTSLGALSAIFNIQSGREELGDSEVAWLERDLTSNPL